MANKIAQITVGDLKVIHLDANPQMDGVGYDADKGSLAVFQNGANAPLLFIKRSNKGGVATDWFRYAGIGEVHQVIGNVYTSALPALIGSLVGSTNLDVKMVRNSVAQIELLADGGDYRESKISLLEGLEVREHIVDDGEAFGLAYNIETSKNFVIFAQSSLFAGSEFVSLGFNPSLVGFLDAFTYQLMKGSALKAVYTNASETLNIASEEIDLVIGRLKKIRVTMMGRLTSDKANSNFMHIKELAVRVDEANDEHYVLFQQDFMTYAQDGTAYSFTYQYDVATKKQLQVVMTGHDQVEEMEMSVAVEVLASELTV